MPKAQSYTASERDAILALARLFREVRAEIVAEDDEPRSLYDLLAAEAPAALVRAWGTHFEMARAAPRVKDPLVGAALYELAALAVGSLTDFLGGDDAAVELVLAEAHVVPFKLAHALDLFAQHNLQPATVRQGASSPFEATVELLVLLLERGSVERVDRLLVVLVRDARMLDILAGSVLQLAAAPKSRAGPVVAKLMDRIIDGIRVRGIAHSPASPSVGSSEYMTHSRTTSSTSSVGAYGSVDSVLAKCTAAVASATPKAMRYIAVSESCKALERLRKRWIDLVDATGLSEDPRASGESRAR